MFYNWLKHERDDNPRNLAALGTGAAAGVGGVLVPIGGLALGLALQLLRPPAVYRGTWEHVADGLVDGSVALLARRLLAGDRARAAGQLLDDDRMGLVGR